MKRLVVLAVAAVAACVVNAATETVDGIEWTYTVSGGKASVEAVPQSTTGVITVPSTLGGSSVTSIGDYAFRGCSGLTSVTIPTSVTSIGWIVFYGCSGLTSVTIPSSVTSIGSGVFVGCSGLVEILVVAGNKHYISENGVLFNKSKTEIVAYPGGKGGSHYTIPSSVTSIGDYAFRGCSGLTSVTIPSSVTSIGKDAFFGCSGLTSVTIPSSVTSIGQQTFSYCSGLTSVTIPSSVTSIGWGAFFGCSGLTSVTIPKGVKSVGGQAFYGCSGLTSVTIPSSVTSIGENAFGGCDALKTVYVAKGDTERVKNLLQASYFDTSKVTFVENLTPSPTPTPTPEPESEEAFKAAHTFNGLVTDEYGMCGMVQVVTAKKTAKGDVKVSGFVMLEDGKKQTLKAVTAKASGGAVSVTTKAGKVEMSLTVTDEGFTGTFGDMSVASGEVGEETGILSGTLKMSYFDAKTGKVKTKSITIKGLTDGAAADVSATVKGQGEKFFRAEIAE